LSRSLATMVSVLSRQARRLANLSATTQRLLEEVQRERTTLAGAMANMSDGLVVLDVDHEVRYSNAHAAALLGVDERSLNDQGAGTLLAAIESATADPAATRAAWERALTRLAARPSFEVDTVGSPPRQVLLQFYAVCDAAGADQGVGLVLRDVTAE